MNLKEDDVQFFIYIVFYRLSDESEFNFLAAFDSEDKAIEYKNRNVWKHLNLFISRQPVY